MSSLELSTSNGSTVDVSSTGAFSTDVLSVGDWGVLMIFRTSESGSSRGVGTDSEMGVSSMGCWNLGESWSCSDGDSSMDCWA